MDLQTQVADAVLASAADAIIAADAQGVIRFWNPGAQRLFGHAPADAIGQSLDLIIPPALRARHWNGYKHVMATGQSRYGASGLLSVPGVRRDGTGVSLEFSIVPLRDADGRMAGMVAVLRDVTQRFEQIRELKRRLAERAT